MWYSERLGEIEPGQFQAALDHFGLGRLISAAPTTTGNFGQNVFLISTGGEYVFRGAPHFDWQFPKEQFMARIISQQTNVPVPWPYLHEPSAGVFGWPFVLMPRLSGTQLADVDSYNSLTLEDRVLIAEEQGKMLAELQTAQSEVSGEFSLAANAIEPFPRSYGEWIRTEILRMVGDSREIASVDAFWVQQLLTSLETALQVDFVPSLVHGDYATHNMVATRTGSAWSITGLFDLMTAHLGDGEADLSRQFAIYAQTDKTLARTFIASYTAAKPPRPGFADRFRAYLLHERLIVWEFAHRTSKNWWDPRLGLREWLDPYFSAIPQGNW